MDVVTGRSKIATKYGIVAASQPLAARAGTQVLERGGHAADAAIAANAVMGLVEPHMNGIGGDLFAIVYDARTGAVHGLNASGWAPRALTPALLRSRGITEMPSGGIHSVTVPGAVAGWDALRSRFGRLTMTDILAPAIFYADHGFPVSDVVAATWAGWTAKLAAEPNAAHAYLPGGRAPEPGEIFRNKDLAASLRVVAQRGAAVLAPSLDASSIGRAVAAALAQAAMPSMRDRILEAASTWYSMEVQWRPVMQSLTSLGTISESRSAAR